MERELLQALMILEGLLRMESIFMWQIRLIYTIRQIVISTGVVTTFAGTTGVPGSSDGTGTSASFIGPFGIARDGVNLYVADTDIDTGNSTIRQIVISTGVVTTLAGVAETFGSSDGTASAALFNKPESITTDGTNLYLTDTENFTIRKIVISTGAVTTLAGTALSSGFTDATGAAARFDSPSGITTDGTNLYVADTDNSSIRQIVISTGAVTTLAGNGRVGSTDGPGPSAEFNVPNGITTDGTNLYVVDTENFTIRKIVISTGAVTTLAGTAGLSGSIDAIGVNASFLSPQGIVTDGVNLYVTDTDNDTIRKIVISTGEVTTLAGTAGSPGSTDGTGPSAQFTSPEGITTDGTNLYVADSDNETIRRIVIATGVVTTLAGVPGVQADVDGLLSSNVYFTKPMGIVYTPGFGLFVTNDTNVQWIQ